MLINLWRSAPPHPLQSSPLEHVDKFVECTLSEHFFVFLLGSRKLDMLVTNIAVPILCLNAITKRSMSADSKSRYIHARKHVKAQQPSYIYI
jgi:hypothetical protein